MQNKQERQVGRDIRRDETRSAEDIRRANGTHDTSETAGGSRDMCGAVDSTPVDSASGNGTPGIGTSVGSALNSSASSVAEIGKKGRSKIFWALASVILAALTVCAVVSQSRHFTAEGFFIYLKNANPVWLGCAALCMLCFIFSEAFAMNSLLKYFGHRSRLRSGYVYSTADIFFSAITPSATGGQPASAFFMMRDGISGTVTTVSLILNLALYAMSILIIGIVGAAVSPRLFFGLGTPPKALIIFGIIAQIFLSVMFLMLLRHGMIIRRVGGGLIGLLSRMHLLSRPEAKLKKLDGYIEHYGECASMLRGNLRPLLPALGFNVLQRLSQIAVTVFAFLATGGAPERVGTIFSLQCYVVLGSNCIPVPGAMGVSDYIMLCGLGSIGMPPEAAVSLDLLSRSVSFYICIIVCGISIMCKYLADRRRESNAR